MSANPHPVSSSPDSLPELIQANVVGGNTCRVAVITALGRGTVHVLEGRIVDAAYGDLGGPDALAALLASETSSIAVETGRTTARRTIDAEWWKLLFDAMRLREEGRVPVPRLAAAPPPAPSAGEIPHASAVPSRVAKAASPSPARRFPWLAVAGVVVVLGAGAAWVTRRSPAPSRSAVDSTPVPAVPSEPVEASTLTDPGDAAPQIVQAPAPTSPDPSLALRPEIVCRILVDEKGQVADAKIWRSRLDLAAFEEAALVAVRSWTFTPARKANVPVRAWMNVSVSFS